MTSTGSSLFPNRCWPLDTESARLRYRETPHLGLRQFQTMLFLFLKQTQRKNIMKNTNYADEAKAIIHALKLNNQLEPAIERIIFDLRIVSTFDCFVNGSPKNAADLIA